MDNLKPKIILFSKFLYCNRKVYIMIEAGLSALFKSREEYEIVELWNTSKDKFSWGKLICHCSLTLPA